MSPKLEIACFNLESVRIAFDAGADRIEFCNGIEEGGTTPNFEDVLQAKQYLTIPLNVMIRPRGGHFVYSHDEYARMKMDILRFKSIGVDGFVFGILKNDHSIDEVRNTELVTLASPIPCTFHRAFDEIENVEKSLETILKSGFSTVLTSGCEANAMLGVNTLRKLIHLANNRICIMPGGGVRARNIETLLAECPSSYYHSSAIINEINMADGDEIKSLKNNLDACKIS